MGAEKDGDQDSNEERLELLEFAKALELVEDVAFRGNPGVRVAGVDCLTGEDGCVVVTCFKDPVSSMR